jgi:chorismate dehydratase
MSSIDSATSPLRIGAVAYANAAPLCHGLRIPAELRGLPTQVADWLAVGAIDVGLVPSVELGRIPGLCALPRWGVAADGACESVLLFSRVPLHAVTSVALDGASRTAAALTRVLLAREGVTAPRVVRRDTGTLTERLDDVDAALLIGDPAMLAEPPDGVSAFDLAAEWRRHVGLPFVFAVWASRAGRRLSADEIAAFDAAAEAGLERVPELAAQESIRTGLSGPRLTAYFRALDYQLGREHWRGLRAFLDEAHRIGILREHAEVAVYP